VPDCDVLHAPDLVPPPSATPQVVTVHDLVALAYPELHPPRAAAIQRRQLEVARDRAAVILAVSRSTADLLTARGVDPKKVVVTANGVSTLPPADCSLVPEDPYLLAVGTLTPRKGLETLIGAFATAVLPRGMRLVLAGTPGWQSTRVYEAIRANGVEGRVVCTGKVTDAQLAGLYRNCRAMCMPSLAEGFGLPILEAAAAGAPVIASDLAVFRELEECVALYAAPGDERDWITALEGIVADEDLRRAAVSRGREMARAYTWDRTAGAVLTAYQQAREAS
jgi:glycosyltransferase involved in cell wall biosynthesis